MIYFSNYAVEKFEILKRHNFEIDKEQVIKVLEAPDSVSQSRFSFYISQGRFNQEYNLKIVFKKEYSNIKIITFYPVKL